MTLPPIHAPLPQQPPSRVPRSLPVYNLSQSPMKVQGNSLCTLLPLVPPTFSQHLTIVEMVVNTRANRARQPATKKRKTSNRQAAASISNKTPACNPCRRRKRGCDRAQPSCTHCARKGQSCTYGDGAGGEDTECGSANMVRTLQPQSVLS